MANTKYFFISILLSLVLLGGIFWQAKLTSAQGETNQTETTFPVQEAGMAAYVKLNSSEMRKVLTAALPFYTSLEENNDNYVIGTVEIQNLYWKNYPHLYIGSDGWMVAYYLRDQEASRLMSWQDYYYGSGAAATPTTTLKQAIDFMVQAINTEGGVALSYSDEVKYYHFGVSQANKMTLVVETLGRGKDCSNSFSVTVPGKVYEASYSLYSVKGQENREMSLKVDGEQVFQSEENEDKGFYGFYGPDAGSNYLEAGRPHLVEFSRPHCNSEGAATLLLYQN